MTPTEAFHEISKYLQNAIGAMNTRHHTSLVFIAMERAKMKKSKVQYASPYERAYTMALMMFFTRVEYLNRARNGILVMWFYEESLVFIFPDRGMLHLSDQLPLKRWNKKLSMSEHNVISLQKAFEEVLQELATIAEHKRCTAYD